MEIITFIAGAALATGITYGMKKRNNQTSQIAQVTQKEHSQKAIAIKIPGGVGLNPYTQAERIEQELIQA